MRKLIIFRECATQLRAPWIVEEYIDDKIIYVWTCDSKEEVHNVIDCVDFSAPLRLWSLGRTFTCHRWLEGTGRWWLLFSEGKVWGVQATDADTAVERLGKTIDFIVPGDIKENR